MTAQPTRAGTPTPSGAEPSPRPNSHPRSSTPVIPLRDRWPKHWRIPANLKRRIAEEEAAANHHGDDPQGRLW